MSNLIALDILIRTLLQHILGVSTLGQRTGLNQDTWFKTPRVRSTPYRVSL